MANELAARIKKLEGLVEESLAHFRCAKRCPGCTFLDKVLQKMEAGDDTVVKKEWQMKDLIRIHSFVLQASKCRGFSLGGVKKNISPKDQETQTEDIPAQNVERIDAYVQTTITASYFEQVDKFRRWAKANEASYTRWSFEQLLKFSTTERERENTSVMLQFAKALLQMEDHEFESIFKGYLNGDAVKNLRKRWLEAKTVEEQGKPDFSDCIAVEPQAKKRKTSPPAEEECCENKKVALLTSQVDLSKQLIVDMMKCINAIEGTEEDIFMRLLDNISGFTEALTEQTKLA